MSLFGNNNTGGSGFGGGGGFGANNNQPGNTGSVFGSGGGFGQPAATGTFFLLAYLFLRSLVVNSSEDYVILCGSGCFLGIRDVIRSRPYLDGRIGKAEGGDDGCW